MMYPRGQWSYKTDRYNGWPPRIPRTQSSLTAAWGKMGNKKFDEFSSKWRRLAKYNADSPDY